MTTKINILHVEDSLRITTVLKEVLGKLTSIGTIESAGTFESGKEIINRKNVDVAILDIQLPDGNGIELLKWIKEKYPRTRVMMLSNHTDVCHRAFSKIAGADYFFDKSMEFEKIATALSEINKTNNN